MHTHAPSAAPSRLPRALGFEPKKEEIKKMIADIDKDGRCGAACAARTHACAAKTACQQRARVLCGALCRAEALLCAGWHLRLPAGGC